MLVYIFKALANDNKHAFISHIHAMTVFEPTSEAAFARLAAVQPGAYARTRNALEGAVTRLSPYLTHGLLSLREVYDDVHARHTLDNKDKFVFELGWRDYYRHVWSHLGDGIHESLHPGVLPEDAYSHDMPADVLQACTGIPVIDLAVRELYETGYLHNHARMWLASYLIHLRKVHWHAGASWMMGYLLDGDLASNHLSWQWVAGTGSSKPYLFNAENVAKFAPAPWHSSGTVLDTSYEALDRQARSPAAVEFRAPASRTVAAMQQPDLLTAPPASDWAEPDSAVVAGRDAWLMHPWSLRAPPPGDEADRVSIGVGFVESHVHNPWSERRWSFVSDGLRALTPHLWWGSVHQLAQALQGARSVQWHPDPHVNPAMEQLQLLLQQVHLGRQIATPQPQHSLFEPVTPYCRSFSQWWRQTSILA